MRKKLDDEYWARAKEADQADNSLVGYESPRERPQHTFEVRTLPARSTNRASSSTATYRTRPSLVRKAIKNPLTRLTKESLDRAEKAGSDRAIKFDLIKQAWTTSNFRERVQFQREVGKLLTGTVAQQVIGDIGEACSTCRSRRRISTERTKEFAKRIRARAAARPKSEAREKSPLLLTEDEADDL